MIINWRKKDAGLLTVSMIKDGTIVKTLSLIPGHNELSDDEWDGIKGQLEDKIKVGDIVPIEVESKKEVEVNGKTKSKRITATDFRDLPAEKALKIVRDTYNKKTLNKWRKDESRDEIRAAISEQLDLIKNPNKKTDQDD